MDTSSEFISSPGDEFDIVVDYVKALRTDPVALQRLGHINRRAAFGYSASGYRLRGLLRLKMGKGLFDFSLERFAPFDLGPDVNVSGNVWADGPRKGSSVS